MSTPPSGFRTDSTRTPNASRAGALHHHHHHYLHNHYIMIVTFRNARLSTGRASAPDVPGETLTSHDARCCFPPCGEPKAPGTYFCKEHGRRWSQASECGPRKTDPVERFHAAGWTERVVVEALGPCWEWNGTLESHGYGNFTMPGARSAHRAAYLFEHGSIPAGLHVLHECDNPPCVNPAHLTAGTRSDNMTGMWDRRRHPTGRLTDAQVLEVRRRYTGARGEQTTLAREYGVSSNHINLIVRGLARRRAIAQEQAGPARMMPGGAR